MTLGIRSEPFGNIFLIPFTRTLGFFFRLKHPAGIFGVVTHSPLMLTRYLTAPD